MATSPDSMSLLVFRWVQKLAHLEQIVILNCQFYDEDVIKLSFCEVADHMIKLFSFFHFDKLLAYLAVETAIFSRSLQQIG
jgi:hypothetical protein